VTAPTLATPATTADLRALPVDPDDGFPQSFLLGVGEHTYLVELYVDLPEHLLDRRADPRTPVDLVGSATTPAQGMLIGTLARQSPDGVPVELLRRRLLPGLLYTAGELRLVVDELRIAVGNLNGAGSFGSVLRARAGLR
jgi:hypothetical protein